jgi:ATP-dependent DNA helicase DinG
MPDRKYIFLDLETTGLDPERDEIIEIGAVKAMQGEVTDTFQVLVKPGREISYKIKKLTGITDEMLKGAPAVKTVLPQLLDFIGDLPVIGHNISFDLGFINIHPGYALTNEIIDTMELARLVLPTAARYRLGSLAEKLTGAMETQHRALEDARAAADIFFKLLEILEKLDITVLRDINRLLAGSDWSGKDILRRLEERKSAFFPDGKIAAAYKFMNRDPELKEKFFQLPDKNNGPGGRVLIDPAALQCSLGDDGPFARMYPDYIYRPQQAGIVALAARAFNEEKHLLIEAGTGTGKSLAYLLPAIYWAVENNSRVVVATHTINLQEQLWQKDLPVIKEITGLEFQEALVKGRNNYLCLRKWEQKKKQPEALNAEEKLFLARLQIWLTETLEGDRSEINLNARESALWPDICADPDTCLGPKCSWFSNHCFFMTTRRQADAAHILITNHSVLLSDLRTDNRILPPHEYLIVDEAHNLEEQAGDQLGTLVSSGAVYKTLVNLRQFVDNRIFAGETATKASGENVITAVKDARAGFREFSDCLLAFCRSITEAGDDYTWHTVRIRSGQQSGRLWEALHTALENFTGRLRTAAAAMEQLYREYAGSNDGEDIGTGGFMREMEYQVKTVMQIAADLNNILLAADPEIVSWVESDKTGEQYSLKAVPVSVGEILADRLFRVKKGVILSSATLSVDGNFTHFKDRIGLTLVPEESILEIQVSSPFNYEEQSFLGVIRDLPDPGTVPDEIFAGEIAPVLAEIAKIFQGRTMVLFTSHRMLRQAYALLSAELAKEDIVVLGHNIDGSRTRIIDEFRTNPRSVLLGANSFWEGVDLSGNILKCVVIVKLPFSPPNLPLTEARMEKLAAMKKNGFTNLLLPQAIIRMKQGFGRLIRSERDEGVVVLLDRRITEKRYGRKIFNSLPLRSHLKGDRHMILQKLADWVDGNRAAPFQFKLITGADHFKSQPFSGKIK